MNNTSPFAQPVFYFTSSSSEVREPRHLKTTTENSIICLNGSLVITFIFKQTIDIYLHNLPQILLTGRLGCGTKVTTLSIRSLDVATQQIQNATDTICQPILFPRVAAIRVIRRIE